jgi:quercetin dioxygenase-like cupin family protein
MQIMGIKLLGPYATFYTSNQTGDEVKEHTHTYPHSCTVISGSVRARCDGKEKVLEVGQSVIFPKGLPHSITPMSIGTIFVNSTAELSQGEDAQFIRL